MSTKTRWVVLIAAILGCLSEVVQGLDRLTHSSLGNWGRLFQALAPKLGADFPVFRIGVFDPLVCCGFLLLLVFGVRHFFTGGRLRGPTLLVLSLIWFSSLLGMLWVPAYMVYFAVEIGHRDEYEIARLSIYFASFVSHVVWFLLIRQCLHREAMSVGAQVQDEGAAEAHTETVEPALKWMRGLHFLLDPWLGILVCGFWAARLVTVGRFWGRYQDGPWEGTEVWIWFPAGILALIVFYVVFEMAWQRTPGKFLTGSFVVNSNGVRDKIGFRAALLRTLIRFVPLEGLSFFRGKGGWHDTWTSTRVECTPRSKTSLGESMVVGFFILLSTAFVVILDPALDARVARLDKQKNRSWRASNATYDFENGMDRITKSHLLRLDIPKGNEKDEDRVMLKVEKNENGVITAAKMETSGTRYSGVPEYYLLHQEDFPRIKIDTAVLKKYVLDGIKEPDGPGFDYLGDGSSYFLFDCGEISSARPEKAVLMPGPKKSVILEVEAWNEPFRILAMEEGGKNKQRKEFPKIAEYNNFEYSENKQDRRKIKINLSKNTLSEIGDTAVLVLEDATGETRIHLIRFDSSDQLRIRTQRELY